jgi:hypothetical protein
MGADEKKDWETVTLASYAPEELALERVLLLRVHAWSINNAVVRGRSTPEADDEG